MNTSKTLKQVSFLVGLVVILGVILFAQNFVFGSLTKDDPAQDSQFRNYQFFYATTTDAVSTAVLQDTGSFNEIDKGYFVIAGAERVSFYFQTFSTEKNMGTTTFSVDITPDGTNWYPYARLLPNFADTSASGLGTATTTVLTNATANATSTVVTSLQLEESVYAVRCSGTLASGATAVATCEGSASW